MGLKSFFKSLFGSTQNETNSEAQTEKTSGEQPKTIDLAWFASEEGQDVYQKTMTPENIIKEEKFINENYNQLDERIKSYTYSQVMGLLHIKGEYSPCSYFQKLLSVIDGKTAHYGTFTTNTLVDLLLGLAKPFTINEDGDLEEVKPALNSAEMVSIKDNPLLGFLSSFTVFDFSEPDTFEKIDLWMAAIFFIVTEIKLGNKKVLEENPWLFAKETYISAANTIRTKKGFYKTGLANAKTDSAKMWFEKNLGEEQ